MLSNVRRAEHASRAAARAEIEALYRHHSPSKIAEIDSLIAYYGAAKLSTMIREKYAARAEIEALYRQHNPSKIAEIDSLMAHYGAAKLLEKVREKYARGRTEAEEAVAASVLAAVKEAEEAEVAAMAVAMVVAADAAEAEAAAAAVAEVAAAIAAEQATASAAAAAAADGEADVNASSNAQCDARMEELHARLRRLRTVEEPNSTCEDREAMTSRRSIDARMEELHARLRRLRTMEEPNSTCEDREAMTSGRSIDAELHARLRRLQGNIEEPNSTGTDREPPPASASGAGGEGSDEAPMLPIEIQAAPVEVAPVEVPPDMICPITREIMHDPVIALDGHSYEREAIEGWFSASLCQGSGHFKSPLTNERLAAHTVTPNHTLRKVIEHFISENPDLELDLEDPD